MLARLKLRCWLPRSSFKSLSFTETDHDGAVECAHNNGSAYATHVSAAVKRPTMPTAND